MYFKFIKLFNVLKIVQSENIIVTKFSLTDKQFSW